MNTLFKPKDWTLLMLLALAWQALAQKSPADHQERISGLAKDLVLADTTITWSAIFKAAHSIVADSNVNVASGANVTFQIVTDSGAVIVLKPGFIASPGCIFRAFIGSGIRNSAPAETLKAAAPLEQGMNKNSKIAGTETQLAPDAAKETNAIPQGFSLSPNHPNPFNPTTKITYGLPRDIRVTLKIYNSLGHEVRTLVAGFETAGFKSVVWNAKNDAGQSVPSGVYLLRMAAGDHVQTKRMLLLK
jgi:hypothetical protein